MRTHLASNSVKREPATFAVDENPSKIEALYLKHWHEAARLAYFITGDPHLAEEIAQESLVRVLSRLPSLRRKEAFGSYLSRTVVNLARTMQRRQRSEREVLQNSPATRHELEPPDLGTREQVWTRLQRLPARQKVALVLRYFEDMSEAQVADVMRTSPKAVKSLISRGLAALRENTEELR